MDIDLRAIAENVGQLVAYCAPAELCAVVKADAYGHGDVPVAQTALASGARWLAVALVEEGVRLREGGIQAPILVLSEPPTSAAHLIHEWGLTPTVYSEPFLDALIAAGSHHTPLGIEIKIDTGMHRVGTTHRAGLGLARKAVAALELDLDGVWTHFAVAEEDPDFTKLQVERFQTFLAALSGIGIDVHRTHVANSAGTLGGFGATTTMVRCGLAIYGLYPDPSLEPLLALRPAMRIVSAISHISRQPAGERPSYGRKRALETESTIATVPIGYADGVPRRLSSLGGEVLIRGKRFPLAGTVTMDQIVVDTGDEPVAIGDEVVMLGTQGDLSITAEEWADKLETINYEIICQIGPRLPRRHHA